MSSSATTTTPSFDLRVFLHGEAKTPLLRTASALDWDPCEVRPAVLKACAMHHRLLLTALLLLSCRSGADPSTSAEPSTAVASDRAEVPPEPPPLPTIVVTVAYPGAGLMDVERSVTARLEEGLVATAGLESLQSVSREGHAEVRLTFEAALDPYEAALRTREALSLEGFSLPPAAETPLLRIDHSRSPVATVVVTRDSMSLLEMAAQAQAHRRALESIANVVRVDSLGAARDRVEVTLDPAALRAFDVTPVDVVHALEAGWAGLISLPGGTLGDTERYVVRTGGERDIETLGPMVVRRGEPPVLLRDVATITLRPDRLTTVVLHGELPAVALDVYTRPSADRTALTDAIQEAVPGTTVMLWSAAEPVVITIVAADEDEFFTPKAAARCAGTCSLRSQMQAPTAQ